MLEYDKMKSLVEEISEFETPDELAHYFADLEIKSIPGITNRCAVADYMKMRLNEIGERGWIISVGRSSVSFLAPVIADSRHVPLDFDGVVMQFVARFDDREYPELINQDPDIG